MTDSPEYQEILSTLFSVADAIEARVSASASWKGTDGHVGQFQADIDADEVARSILINNGYTIFSEESGFSEPSKPEDKQTVVVIDPVDGSTNASRGIPFFAVSLCALVQGRPVVSVVRNLANGDTYHAEIGNGSFKNGKKISVSGQTMISRSIVATNGYSKSHLGWEQYRAFGSAALELCMVAEGSLDAFIDLSESALGSWDVLGGALICLLAGSHIIGLDDFTFSRFDLSKRWRVVAAGSEQLASDLSNRAWR